ncbi:Gfo/Idh/MocA family oxidoreductase [Acetomicrobium sp.]|uniref:Gfo/Idh/MocA family protein n=1 Tax=Acetomicrobium sp. TaxID=1872099 RepID=UPI002FC7E112
MQDSIKVAVIGAGNWGKNIVKNFYELGALSAIVDEDEGRLNKVGKDYKGVHLLTSLNDLWKMDIPAVAIATSAPTHYEITKTALSKGRDVFVEKPFTLNASQAEELVTLAKSSGRIIMVGHLLLYQPAIRWIKDCILKNTLGKLYFLHQERLNLGRARRGENALWSLGVHDVAVFLDLVGRNPQRVEVVGQPVLQKDVEDDVYLHLAFSGGVAAHLHASWLWPEKHRRLTAVFERGMLVYDEIAQTVTLHKKYINSKLENMDEGQQVVFKGNSEPLKLELKHFIECCQSRQRPYSDGESAVGVIKILEEASNKLGVKM